MTDKTPLLAVGFFIFHNHHDFSIFPIFQSLAAWFPLVWLCACASRPPVAVKPVDALNTRIAPRVQAAGTHSKSVVWEHFKLPGKRPSTFDFVLEDRRVAIAAHAQSSASMLWQVTRVEPSDLGTVKFSWKLPDLIQYADVSVPEFDDSPVRVVLAFEGDRGNFSAKNAMLSELARLLTGEELPYATLMYVWSKTRPAGSVIINPRTDRIRKLVVESGNGKLNSWVDYERTIRADFEKAFGEAPGALMSVSVMTDSDNTQSNTQAWYGPLTITAAKP